MEAIVLDASPLIYLAKLDALDVLPRADRWAIVPGSVWSEVARPTLTFRFPEIASIDRARSDGWVSVAEPTAEEATHADDLEGRLSGLHRGELDCLAIASDRRLPICLHERQASHIARTLGVETIHIVELLAHSTPERDRLEHRIRRFAGLTNLATADLDALLQMIREDT